MRSGAKSLLLARRQSAFGPHRDYYDAAILLEGANPDACASTIPLGVDGKPFFVSGPYDDVPRIMAQLKKAVGPGSFEFVAQLGNPVDFLTDEEW